VKIAAAVAWEAGATLSIEEFDLDDPRDDEILVRVEAVGVCHTDDNARLGRLPVVFPIILGHEGAGTVERVGRNVTRVSPGDQVLFTPDYCGSCEQCVLGYTPYCDQVVAYTFTGTRPDGSPRAHQHGRAVGASFFGQSSFATYSLVTERNIVPVPSGAPLHYLAGFTCGVQTGAGAIPSTGSPADWPWPPSSVPPPPSTPPARTCPTWPPRWQSWPAAASTWRSTPPAIQA
jgi:aryl-alcohol dehydrogenase